MKIITFSIATVMLAIVIGCSCTKCHRQHVLARLKSGKGTDLLIQESKSLVAVFRATGKTKWRQPESLPPTIAALEPQSVIVVDDGEAAVVNIKIIGGFHHEGILVVCEERVKDYSPYRLVPEHLTKVGSGVFLYND